MALFGHFRLQFEKCRPFCNWSHRIWYYWHFWLSWLTFRIFDNCWLFSKKNGLYCSKIYDMYFGLLRFLGIFLSKMLRVLQTQGAPKSFGQNHRVLSVSHRTLSWTSLFGFFLSNYYGPNLTISFSRKKGQLKSQIDPGVTATDRQDFICFHQT